MDYIIIMNNWIYETLRLKDTGYWIKRDVHMGDVLIICQSVVNLISILQSNVKTTYVCR